MVDAVTAITASAASSATAVDRSLSITSEPDNKWVAERQSQIEADQTVSRGRASSLSGDLNVSDEELEHDLPPLFEGHSRRLKPSPEESVVDGDAPEAHLLSGESERIGSTNFDDDTPFGGRTAII